MRIVELRAENVKRLKAVRIKPAGSVVEVTGRNGEGKTSVLDSIAMCLGGKGLEPPRPVRKGQKKAQVILNLGDLLVCRRWNEAGESTLSVTTSDGQKYSSPQKVLDAMNGRLTFDPLEFSRMKPKDQVSVLKEISGLDFDALDRKRKGTFDERTDINRQLKSAEGALAAMPQYEGVPDHEVSDEQLAASLRELENVGRANQQQREELSRMYDKLEQLEGSQRVAIAQCQSNVDGYASRIEQLQNELRLAQDNWGKAKAALATAQTYAANSVAEMKKAIEVKESAVSALKDPDTSEISGRIAEATELNKKVRANSLRMSKAMEVEKLRAQSEALTARLESIDVEKGELLAAANMPIKGLAFNDEGVLLNGLPFEQASSAEQLRTSVAMGVATNPKIRVMLIRDGSLLDSKSMDIVREMAEAHDMQCWIEVATDGEAGPGVVIEDGEATGAEALPTVQVEPAEVQ